MRLHLICGVLAAALLLPSTALAHDSGSIQHKDKYLRSVVIKKHGKDAPGCDLVAKKCKKWPNPKRPKIHRYFEQLRKLAFPERYLVVKAGPPRQKPAGTQSAHMAASGLASCIVQHESGGNPMAQNGQYKGIAQWSAEAWARHGGTQYAATPHGATKQQQLMVLSNGLSKFGCRDWCPYDGCG
jgi:hypothetical protein